ncbi:uncharacterized protein RJT20DRAFT_145503 [Scheffersomyces xylosifermentans]|uniref:uncharacterized protein n=1 Tax=Scheffersomyces xylosifermentans TaxID=1304137 RepID=UPI00315CF400
MPSPSSFDSGNDSSPANNPSSTNSIPNTISSNANDDANSNNSGSTTNVLNTSSSSGPSSHSHHISAAEKQLIRRKKHKNSKLGCPNCKKRRVKCSEDLPACTNCIKHKVKCGYLDYSEERLNDLRQAKLAQEFDELTTSVSNPEKDGLSSTSTSISGANSGHSTAATSTSSSTKSKQKAYSLSNASNINPKASSVVVPTKPASFAGPSEPHKPISQEQQEQQQLQQQQLQQQYNSDSLNNMLNFQHSSITQNFDNLLNNNITEGEEPIIYPVLNAMLPDFNQPLQHQVAPADIFTSNKEFYPDAMDFTSSNAMYLDNPDDFSSSLFNSDNLVFTNGTPAVPSGLTPAPLAPSLPNAIHMPVTFTVKARESPNYQLKLMETLKVLGPSIDNGTCPLPTIRSLYYVWLNSFIYRSYKSEIMMSCLLNLTTNYLISNCFLNCPTYRKYIPLGTPQIDEVALAQNTKSSDKLSHYAKVIKDLRYLLNRNEEPDLCASVSYILSLMSIYDPEATLNSSNCFRDGLFSILSYNLSTSIKKSGIVPIIIHVHLKLMNNIARSIYMPGYDPSFLHEFQSVLNEYGALVRPVINQMKEYTINNNLPPIKTLQFISLKVKDLTDYTNDTINNYIPRILENFSDLDMQQELLFDMIYRWVRFFPSRLSMITASSDPLEKVLYLFYKVLKKALFAIFPQVKFFFLRDFDSPLMLDVFALNKDVDIFLSELDNPINNVLPWEVYAPIIPQLKSMSSYLIRIITFLQIRVGLLYRYIVYEPIAKEKFPINDVRAWRNSITNVEETRQEFNKVIGLNEVPIKSFFKNYIKPENYPRMVKNGDSPATDVNGFGLNEGIEVDVDFSSLSESGLLRDDFDIMAKMGLSGN